MIRSVTFGMMNDGARETRTVVYREVKTTRSESFVCVDCGERRVRNKTFSKTVNPLNVRPDGHPKTLQDVRADVTREADAWRPGPSCGCVAKAQIDERPEKRTPDVERAPYPDDIVVRLNEIKEEISAINAELNRRFAGTPFTIDGRQAYVTRCEVDLHDLFNGRDIMVNVWTSKKKNPLEQYDWEYMRLFKVLQARDAS